MMKIFSVAAFAFAAVFMPAIFAQQPTQANEKGKPAKANENGKPTPANVRAEPGDVDPIAGKNAMAFLEAYLAMDADGMGLFLSESDYRQVQRELEKLKSNRLNPAVIAPEVFRKKARLLTAVTVGDRMFAVIVFAEPQSNLKSPAFDWVEISMTSVPGTNLWRLENNDFMPKKYQPRIPGLIPNKNLKAALAKQSLPPDAPAPEEVALKNIRAVFSQDYLAAAAFVVPEERAMALTVWLDAGEQITEEKKKLGAEAEIYAVKLKIEGSTAQVKVMINMKTPEKDIQLSHVLNLQFRNGVWQVSSR